MHIILIVLVILIIVIATLRPGQVALARAEYVRIYMLPIGLLESLFPCHRKRQMGLGGHRQF